LRRGVSFTLSLTETLGGYLGGARAKFTSGKLQLSGTLRLPYSGGLRGVLLLEAESGQLDRNENNNKIPIIALKEIAEYLANYQIDTCRYD
jgi:hypothetical protein